jgi:hypothetical protein
MFALGPGELVACLIPAVIVLASVVIVVYAVRRKPAKTTDANPPATAQEDPGPGNSVEDGSRINTSTETTVSPRNGLATISLVLGITAIAIHVLFGTSWSNLLGPVAVIAGAIALVQIGRQGGRGKWAAIAGIALGTLPFIITLGAILLLILSAPAS